MDNNLPFTIRLELLKLANSIESDRIWSERNRLEQDWNSQREFAVSNNQPIPPFPNLPVATHNDVIEVAKKLNTFVSNKE